MTTPDRFGALWRSLLPIGRVATGGYRRFAWSAAELECREWFVEEARDRDLTVDRDGNGNLFAWWGDPAAGDAVLTGSHLDSVPDGGAYDGPLGVVSALLAVDELRYRRVTPRRPVGIAVFTEEEGSRFGVACLGSRLLTGSLDPVRAAGLVDRDGTTLADVMAGTGADPAGLGPDPGRLAGLSAYVELHVEQGRALAELGAAVGVASAIWPHGRWRLDFTGEGNHAGTTRMADRRDPMLALAYTVLAANKEARLNGGHATIGRVEVTPNATNAVPSAASAWLDARAADAGTLAALVEAIRVRAIERAARDGTSVGFVEESATPVVEFHSGLRDRIAALLTKAPGPAALTQAGAHGGVPVLPTGAGHDAGVLAAAVPTAMLFVRNPTGVSHAPAEQASDSDCAAGVRALTEVLAELACR